LLIETRLEKITLLVSSIGSIIIGSAIFLSFYTRILPLTYITAGISLLIPSIYIGLINEEADKAIIITIISAIGTIIMTAFLRSIPGLLGVFPNSNDFFIFQQITLTLPLLFIAIPFFTIGTFIGFILKEFLFDIQKKQI